MLAGKALPKKIIIAWEETGQSAVPRYLRAELCADDFGLECGEVRTVGVYRLEKSQKVRVRTEVIVE